MNTFATEWHSKQIPGADGMTLHVRQSSVDASKRVCVLLHGSADGGYIWSEIAESLAQDYRVVLIDLRGHGDSSWSPAQDYRVAAHVRDLRIVLEALQLERFALIGHSLGGQISIHLCAGFRNRVLGLMLADFGPNTNAGARERARLNLKDSLRRYDSIAEYQQVLIDTRPLLPPQTAAWLARESLRECADGFRLKVDPALAEIDSDCDDDENNRLWVLLRQTHCPVLVVRGAGSAMLSRLVAEQIKATLPAGTLKVVPNAGHALMLDNGEYFAGITQAFLRSVLGRPAAPPGAALSAERRPG